MNEYRKMMDDVYEACLGKTKQEISDEIGEPDETIPLTEVTDTVEKVTYEKEVLIYGTNKLILIDGVCRVVTHDRSDGSCIGVTKIKD